MRYTRSKFSLLLLLFWTGAFHGASAEVPGSRAETWEFVIQANNTQSSDITFDGGAEVAIESDVGFGFGVAYNFSRLFALRGELGWNTADYRATRVLDGAIPALEEFNASLDTATLGLVAELYFFEATVSPFVNVSAGWTYVDTNIPSGPAQAACWWDPWYGYICDGYQPTRDDTESSYGAAAGLRFDLDDSIFLRASIGQNYVDYGKGADTDDYTISSLGIGFSY